VTLVLSSELPVDHVPTGQDVVGQVVNQVISAVPIADPDKYVKSGRITATDACSCSNHGASCGIFQTGEEPPCVACGQGSPGVAVGLGGGID
jgi:hypothetical protein